MPRKIFDKFLPSNSKIKKNKILLKLGDKLNDVRLWGINRKSIALGFAFGMFIAMIPIPMQMLVVAFLAIIFKFNIPISITLVWITNPITMPFIFYFEYIIGSFILGKETSQFYFDINWISENMILIGSSMYLGSIVLGLFLGILSYVLVNKYWVWKINKNKRIK